MALGTSLLAFGIPLFNTGYLILYLLGNGKSWRHHLNAFRVAMAKLATVKVLL